MTGVLLLAERKRRGAWQKDRRFAWKAQRWEGPGK
jgi:hypothetical protein